MSQPRAGPADGSGGDRLLRQYFPKGSSLADYSQADLDAIAHRLNTRPRKTTLDYATPADKLAPLLR